MSRHANQRRLGAGKFRAILSSVLAIGLAIGGITGLAAAPAAAVGNGQDNHVPVYICHAVGNPADYPSTPGPNKWVPIKQLDNSAMVSAILGTNGHAEHQGHWDIIPAFDWKDKEGAEHTYPGSAPWLSGYALVNGMTGKQIYANGCSSEKTTIDITKTAMDSKGENEITAPLELGTTFLYVITVENKGKADANLLTVTDTIPAGLTFDSNNLKVTVQPELDSITSCSFNTPDLTCDVDTLAPNQVLTLTLPVTVASTATAGAVITNTATACAGNVTSCDTDDAVITVVKRSVTIEKTSNVADGSIAAGQEFNYVLTVINNGNVPASEVIVKDTLPKDISRNGDPTFPTVDWTFTSGLNGTDPSRTDIAFTLIAGKTLPVGDSVEFTIPVKASVALELTTDQIVNTAGVCATNTICDTGSVTLDREWIKVVAAYVCLDETTPEVNYTIITHGVGTNPAPTATISVGEITAATVQVIGNDTELSAQTSWSSGDIGKTVTATVDGVSGTAEQTYPTGDAECALPGDLSVEKTQGVVGTDTQTGDPIDVVPGNVIRYVVTVKNIGGKPAGGILTDSLPGNLAFISVTPEDAGDWAAITEPQTEVGGSIGLRLADPLAPGDSKSVTVVARVVDDPGTDGVANTACVLINQSETEQVTGIVYDENDCDKVIAHVPTVDIPTLPVKDADIDIEKSVTLGKNNPNTSDFVNKEGVPVVNAGSRLLYTLVISNAGLGAATGVEVTDTLPAELRIPKGAVIVADGWTLVDGTYHSFGESLTFVRDVKDEISDSLGTGATWTILIPVQVNPDATKVKAGTIVNTAEVCAENDFTSPNGSVKPTGCEADDATVLIETLEVPTLAVPEPEVPTLALTGSDGFNGTLAIGLLALTGGIGILAAARRKGQRV